MRAAALGAILLTSARAARAVELSPGVEVGASEVVEVVAATPIDAAHAGVYPYVAGGLAFDFEVLALIPALGVAFCPELMRWGFLASLALEIPITDEVGFDLLVGATHDQPELRWSESEVSLGGGFGFSFAVGPLFLSPSVAVYGGLNAPGWVLVPSLSVAYFAG